MFSNLLSIIYPIIHPSIHPFICSDSQQLIDHIACIFFSPLKLLTRTCMEMIEFVTKVHDFLRANICISNYIELNLFPACSIWWYGDCFNYLLYWPSSSEFKRQMAGMLISDFLNAFVPSTIDWIVNLIIYMFYQLKLKLIMREREGEIERENRQF